MFLDGYVTDDGSSGATELGPPPVAWMESTPSIQPIGPASGEGLAGIRSSLVDDVFGTPSPVTSGLAGIRSSLVDDVLGTPSPVTSGLAGIRSGLVGDAIGTPSSPGTLGVIGTIPSFSPSPDVFAPMPLSPSIRPIALPPPHPMDVGTSVSAPSSGGVQHLDPTDPAASTGLSTGALVAIGVVALLVILNL